MKNIILFLLFSFIFSCKSSLNEIEVKRYQTIYEFLTKDENKVQPYLEDFSSDASGVKIIPRIFSLNNYQLYAREYFILKKSVSSNKIKRLSRKFTNTNWREDKNFKLIKTEDLKNFHGPLKYLYFSEIRNDSLRVDILSNPFAKYSSTTREKFLIVFKQDSVFNCKKSVGYYE